MNTPSPNPPYFDVLFDRIAAGDEEAVLAFGRHVHWGYWPQSPADPISAQEYQEAAERLCQRLCDTASLENGLQLIDVGCGFGGTIASLNERWQSLAMTGINIDGRQLERAREIVKPASGNRIEWVEADAASLPIDDASCDRVLAVECIFHFDRARFLAEASRVLRPGGSLAISDFVPDDRTAQFLADSDFSGGDAVRWTYGNVDMSCSVEAYDRLARENGLRLTVEDDITEGTLPTYRFLASGAGDWHDRQHAELFLTATRWLEKASRKKLIRYMILRFDKAS